MADRVAEKCGVGSDQVYLLVAPTASLAGSIQVAARVVETGLHKMHEVGFDINTILSGYGTCPLAAIAKKDMKAIGCTNDTVLYGGQAWYTVRTGDDAIAAVIDRLPSSASSDYGVSFYDLFKRYDGDFYKIDPLLFSPAQVSINNLTSGKSFRAGQVDEGPGQNHPDGLSGVKVEYCFWRGGHQTGGVSLIVPVSPIHGGDLSPNRIGSWIMKVGILGQRGGWHEQSLQKSLERHGIKAASFPITAISARQAGSQQFCIGQNVLDDYGCVLCEGNSRRVSGADHFSCRCVACDGKSGYPNFKSTGRH